MKSEYMKKSLDYKKIESSMLFLEKCKWTKTPSKNTTRDHS